MNETETPQSSPINASSDKLWNVLLHLSPFIGLGLIGPLIVFLVTRGDSGSTIPAHARETLNFHISLFIYMVISGILTLIIIGIVLLFVIGIAGAVLAIVGAVKASNDEVYQYPLTIRLVK